MTLTQTSETAAGAALQDEPATSNRRLDVQGLRALAVAFVVCFHAGLPVPGGFVGVDVFFVISGFVITSMLARQRHAGRLRLRTFYARRFRRLTPALALMVSVTVLISALAISPLQGQENSGKTAIGAMLLFANKVIASNTGGYFDAAAEGNPLLHTWSLSVEEQFYLLFPLLLIVGWWLSRRFALLRSGPVLLAAAAGAGSLAIAIVTSRGYQVPHVSFLGFYSPVTRAWEFAAGAVLALAGVRATRRFQRLEGALALLGIAMLVASLRYVTGDTPLPGVPTLLPVIGSLLVIRAGLRSSGNVVSRLLGTRPFVALGDLSYSWYLWHWPLIVFSTILWPGSRPATIAAAGLSLIPAVASYRWVEQPIRNLRNVSARRMASIVALTVVPPLALAGTLLVCVNNAFWSPNVRALDAAVSALPAGTGAGCTGGGLQTERAPGQCQWNVGAPGPPLYLVGDSNADQFSQAVIGAGDRLGRPTTISTFNGCSFLGVSWSDELDPFKEQCRRYVDGTLGWLEQAPHGVVVIGISDSLWTAPHVAVGPTRATESADRETKAAYLESDLRSVVGRLERAGQQVLLMQPIPKPRRVEKDRIRVLFDPERCSTLAVLRGRCPAPVETPRAYEDRVQADPRATISRVAAATGASVLDLRDYFCSATTCSTHHGKLLLYRDGGHITVRTSEALAPTFADTIRRIH
jgi:peptidoglycan/LPS O-acetylase OafA/YrhL